MESSGSRNGRRLPTPRFLLLAGIIAAAGVAVVLIWFEPQKLFIDERVDEAAPGAIEKEDDALTKDDTKEKPTMKGDAMMSFAGEFRSINHETRGTVVLAKAADNHYYVRLEDFSTENGPDLVVYLSSAPASANGTEFASDFVDLGELKGNIGDQNYRVPDGVDLESYRSVVIWCRRFTTPFGAAPLEAV